MVRRLYLLHMRKLKIVFAMAFILINVITVHANESEPGDVRYDSRTIQLDPDLRKTKLYYDSREFKERWRKAIAIPADDEAEYILWTRTFPASASLENVQKDSLRIYNYRLYYALNNNEMLAKLSRNIGKGLPQDKDYWWFNQNYPELPTPPTYAELVVSLINTLEKEKDIENAKEDFSRGIISKKLSNAINDQINNSYYASQDCRKAIRKISASGIESFVKEKWGKEFTAGDVELIDSIPNPWNRRKRMLLAIERDDNSLNWSLFSLLWKDINGDEWNWINNEKPIKKIERYPISVEYKYYESHPQYRFTPEVYESTMHFAYDGKGNLQRVLMPKYKLSWQDMGSNDSDVGMAIARMAYENNDYDIKSANSSTLKYVRVVLGLEKLTGKARAQAAKASEDMVKAYKQAVEDDIRYGNSRKGEAAARKNAANFFGAMLSAAYANHDEAGAGWFSQIEHDYWDILKLGPYKMERLSDTSVKYIYVDKELKPVIELSVAYQTAAPYEVKRTIQAKRID